MGRLVGVRLIVICLVGSVRLEVDRVVCICFWFLVIVLFGRLIMIKVIIFGLICICIFIGMVLMF